MTNDNSNIKYGFDNETETVYLEPKKGEVGKYVCSYSDVNIETHMIKQDKEFLMIGVLSYLRKKGQQQHES